VRVLIVQGPNTGKVLDYSTRQAETAIAGGWAVLPTAEVSPAVPPAEVDVPVIETAVVATAVETAVAPLWRRRSRS